MAGAQRGRKRSRPADATESAEKKAKITETSEKTTKLTRVEHPSHRQQPGFVLTLGEGNTGQLGLGPDVIDRTKPAKVNMPEDSLQICAGGMHTACLTKTGVVYTWGCNDEGALGRPTPEEDDCMEPGRVEMEGKASQISAGDSHTAALCEDGVVYAWGTFRDANGPMGLNGDGNKCERPIKVVDTDVIVKIASGADHLVCLTHDGHIITLGCAEQGQLGRVAECFSIRGGRKGLDVILKPGIVHCRKKATRFSDVWTGSYTTYARSTEGDIYVFGLNNYYQLGVQDMKNRFVPECTKKFPRAVGWKELSGGQHHTLALDEQGRVYALGRSEYGRLGLGEGAEEQREPKHVTALDGKKCVSINCGSCVSFAVAENGEVYAWGMGTNKQLGQSEDDDVWSPVLLTGKQLTDKWALQVSAGGQHTVILAKDKST